MEAASTAWSQLGQREPSALAQAQSEARDIARVLAAHALAQESDAVMQEFEGRLEMLAQTVWPEDPLAGYGLHSSLGAYVVARVAVEWVPAAKQSLRHEPLRRDGLLRALMAQGVAPTTAEAIVGPWLGVEPGFKGEKKGLATSLIAGLGERTLTSGEREQALSQIAVSPRCLMRVASTCHLLDAVKNLLPVLPPESMGAAALAGMTALIIGRPERVREILSATDVALSQRTLLELAEAQAELSAGRSVSFEDDELVVHLPAERPMSPAEADDQLAESHTLVDGGSDGDEDVLEIVEERFDSEEGFMAPIPDVPPRAPTWDLIPDIAEDRLRKYREDCAQILGAVSPRALGLPRTTKHPPSLPIAVPPDPRLVLDALDGGLDPRTLSIAVDGGVFGPLFPPVRSVLRAIVAAAEGRVPSEAAITAAGDLTWAVRRARALGLIVNGDFKAAADAVGGMPEHAAPEGRWAKNLRTRFEGREAHQVGADEARPAAAALVYDLVQQLGRTLSGCIELEKGQSS